MKDLWLSDLNPRSALKGAIKTGKATIRATKEACTPSSTIITLFKVPNNITVAIPAETWKSDNRNNCLNGRLGDAASENGKNFILGIFYFIIFYFKAKRLL